MRSLLTLTIFLAVAAAYAQPKLLKNFEGPAGTPTLGSDPSNLVAFKGEVYFEARDPRKGLTLWHTDGTAEGTKPVEGFENNMPYATYLTPFGDALLYTVEYGDVPGLWKFDGSQKTAIVAQGERDPITGAGGSPRQIIPVNDQMFYFFGYDAEHGNELWKSDGTTEGTTLVKDINPGVKPSVEYQLVSVTVGNVVYFIATDGTHGYELWKSDGTAEGTRMVKDIVPDNNFMAVFQLYVMGSDVYFTAMDRLWKSNGEESGTVPVTGEFDSSLVVLLHGGLLEL